MAHYGQHCVCGVCDQQAHTNHERWDAVRARTRQRLGCTELEAELVSDAYSALSWNPRLRDEEYLLARVRAGHVFLGRITLPAPT